MYTTDEIISRTEARKNGHSHFYNITEIRKSNNMINPITQLPVRKSITRRNVKEEDLVDAKVVEGQSNEYVTMYSNGVMVRELSEGADNPYIKGFVDNNVKA